MPTDLNLFSQKPLIIFGCGGHARSIAAVQLNRYPYTNLVFVDQNAKPGETVLGFPVQTVASQEILECFIAFGDNEKRKRFFEAFIPSRSLISILAQSAQISPYSTIGSHVFIGNLAHIGPEAVVGKNSIINTGAIVEHEVLIGDHCHIGPNAVISGRCTIGNLVFIGVGAVVKDSVRIGSNVIVGAGAVVIEDLLEPGTYVGCPARKIHS